jgi:hypothetical protein
MKRVFKGLIVACAACLVAPAARGEDVPNINKRGTGEKDEKALVEKVARSIVSKVRKAKDITVKSYKFKDGKEAGEKVLEIEAGYKGVILNTAYTAKITMRLNTANKDKWTVTSIDYTDNNKNKVTLRDQKIKALVADFNAAAR